MNYVPQSSYVELLTPTVMVLGDGALGRRFGHEGGGALKNGISALPRTDTELPLSLPYSQHSLSLSHVRIQSEDIHDILGSKVPPLQ